MGAHLMEAARLVRLAKFVAIRTARTRTRRMPNGEFLIAEEQGRDAAMARRPSRWRRLGAEGPVTGVAASAGHSTPWRPSNLPHPSYLGRTPREPGRPPRAQTRSPSADPGSSLEIFGAIRRGIGLGASGDLSTSGICLEGRVRRGSRHWWTSHQKHPLTCLARFVQLLSTRSRSCPWWIESLEWEVRQCSRDPPLRWEAAGRVSGPL